MSTVGELLPMPPQHSPQCLALGAGRYLPDSIDRQIDPPQRADQPGLLNLLSLVAAISGDRVHGHWPEQADFVIVPQGADGQAADKREDADIQQVAVAHLDSIQSRVT